MPVFSSKIISLILVILCLTAPSESFSQGDKDYLENLFEKVERQEKNPETPLPRMYDKLSKNSLSLMLLNKYPKLVVGKIQFLSRLPKDLKRKKTKIKKGQDLVLQYLATPEMIKEGVTFKDFINQIDLTLNDPQSELSPQDWVLMSSAFQTLRAPDSSTESNAISIFIMEYIILSQIDVMERKEDKTKEEDEFLSTLYYILSQIYQNIFNNPKQFHFIEKKENNSPGSLYLALPQTYLSDVSQEYIDPITEENAYEYDVYYPEFDSYYILPSLFVTYDILVIRRLELLEIAVIVAPYYAPAWVPITEYIAVDLRSPYYINRLSPVFWNSYFPLGVAGVNPIFINRIDDRFKHIITSDPRILQQIQDPATITNSLKNLTNPEWRKTNVQKETQLFQQQLTQQANTQKQPATQQSKQNVKQPSAPGQTNKQQVGQKAPLREQKAGPTPKIAPAPKKAPTPKIAAPKPPHTLKPAPTPKVTAPKKAPTPKIAAPKPAPAPKVVAPKPAPTPKVAAPKEAPAPKVSAPKEAPAPKVSIPREAPQGSHKK